MKDDEVKYNLKILEQARSILNAANQQAFSIDGSQELKLHIHPDKSVSAGKFVVDPKRPGGKLAHPETIRAMRKDIFVSDPDLEDFSKVVECKSCHSLLDRQFWIHCPYCQSDIPIGP